MSHIPPAVTAIADQLVAAADKALDQFIADFQEHIAEHDGDPLCPIGVIAVGAEGQAPEDVAFLLAVAVKRLAMPNKEIQL
ncbi:Uncharacterised protein [Mycobacteroides abscessus subsp. abscessus]|uniref:hypothetical protein n=1 Tax=Mycobacteroides TaxID=670516 RepID=UPI000928E2F7|nr:MULTISPECIES: hypothetical protein [Mycobacteroides]MDO3312374.1 hypothetical protein [Mycobacteroides abscessus subsp. abscessus]MDO3344944.1 hypothetical protein [Mycobacteroides abscessus subsp. abscessus]WJR32446.1 hypothetical protein P3F83_18215 [Mycobacteroides immunogenum]SHP09938.1 Uncharacterised protein [Mycobacteroides abscessus subsp. abscessus]SHP23891.1 Uncharacterised protein [Mycobacteroides abscessus subsp. abscessus]